MNAFDADIDCVRDKMKEIKNEYIRDLLNMQRVLLKKTCIYIQLMCLCVSSYLCRPVTGFTQGTSLALMEPHTHTPVSTLKCGQIISHTLITLITCHSELNSFNIYHVLEQCFSTLVLRTHLPEFIKCLSIQHNKKLMS